MSVFDQWLDKARKGKGFIAALDQSGGSTPKALKLYGVNENQYSNDQEMFDRIHEMRTRIVCSPAFNGDRVVGAILFENTLDREIQGLPSSQYLWEKKQVVPFLKVDQGLLDESQGVQLMKQISGLDSLLEKARGKGVFGTKMRSVVKEANAEGISKIVAQQFEIGLQIIDAGLVPILEPEVDIHCKDKAGAESLLKAELLNKLAELKANQRIMLKLTLPEQANHYAECIAHANVVRVVALSGGYSRELANKKLSENKGMIASFSRALTEGLSAQQSDQEFNATLDATIQSIYEASIS